jgi:hypothetical protein
MVPPAVAVHVSTAVIGAVSTGVCTTPLILKLFALADVNASLSGLEMTHDCIPVVIQPMVDEAPDAIALGFATITIDGWIT